MPKLLLLDLDGTVRKSASGAKFIQNPSDQVIIDGARDAIAAYSDWVIIGITNQAGVAYGYKSLDDCILEQKNTIDLLPQIQEIYVCPDKEGTTCFSCGYRGDTNVWSWMAISPKTIYKWKPEDSFRKPGIGMVKAAIDSCFLSCYPILMVGDMESDRECAEAAKIDFMWADNWRKGKKN